VRADTPASPLDSLSNREMQVLKLLASDQTVGDIARELSLSANTISTYRTRLFDKLGIKNPVELVSFAARHQLVAL